MSVCRYCFSDSISFAMNWASGHSALARITVSPREIPRLDKSGEKDATWF